MENDNNLVKVEGEDGKEYNLLILKEFSYKKKKYAVLTEIDSQCDCDDDCHCKEGGECTCGDDCHCKEGGECTCGDDCHCKEGGECTCGDDCCCNEDSIFILEIAKDKDGSEIFKSIDDEKLFNEIIEKADELIED